MRREKMHYSGKRKMHTVKTQIMVSDQGLTTQSKPQERKKA